MAKAKQLPSGTWRILVYSHTDPVTGKRYYESFTAPTKAEVEYAAARFVKNKKTDKDFLKKRSGAELTVGEAIDKYILDHPALSPTTLATYKKHRRVAFQSIMDVPIKKLTDDTMQEAINLEMRRVSAKGGTLSPKTLSCEYGSISTAIKYVSKLTFDVTLPTVPKHYVELPEVSEIIPLIKGLEIELPCMIAMWLSFSMSEVRGIKCSSIRNGKLYVDQVVVTVDGKPVEKSVAKAEDRRRVHSIPKYIMQLIEEQETYKHYLKTGEDNYLIPLNLNQISHRFTRLMKKHGYTNMSFHKLRHMNASIMALLNIPERYAMERGGWKTPHTMRRVYQHTFPVERQIVDAKIDDFFDKLL